MPALSGTGELPSTDFATNTNTTVQFGEPVKGDTGPAGPQGPAGVAKGLSTFSVVGPVTTAVGHSRFYMSTAGTITNVIVSVSSAPVGSAIIIDVKKNGVSIFTTLLNRPTIPAGGFVDMSSIPDVTAFSIGDYYTVDVVQVGSTSPGSDLVVQLEYV
jgi:hypothetical protein